MVRRRPTSPRPPPTSRPACRRRPEDRVQPLVRRVARVDDHDPPAAHQPRVDDRARDPAAAEPSRTRTSPSRHRGSPTGAGAAAARATRRAPDVRRVPRRPAAAGASRWSAATGRWRRSAYRRQGLRRARATRGRPPPGRRCATSPPVGQVRDEEPGVVAAGRVRRGRGDPARERHQPVGGAARRSSRSTRASSGSPAGDRLRRDRRRHGHRRPVARAPRAGPRPPPTARGSRRPRAPGPRPAPGRPAHAAAQPAASSTDRAGQRRRPRRRAGSTAPPGKTCSPGPNAIVDGRRVSRTSGRRGGPGRSRTTVEAGRGVTTGSMRSAGSGARKLRRERPSVRDRQPACEPVADVGGGPALDARGPGAAAPPTPPASARNDRPMAGIPRQTRKQRSAGAGSPRPMIATSSTRPAPARRQEPLREGRGVPRHDRPGLEGPFGGVAVPAVAGERGEPEQDRSGHRVPTGARCPAAPAAGRPGSPRRRRCPRSHPRDPRSAQCRVHQRSAASNQRSSNVVSYSASSPSARRAWSSSTAGAAGDRPSTSDAVGRPHPGASSTGTRPPRRQPAGNARGRRRRTRAARRRRTPPARAHSRTRAPCRRARLRPALPHLQQPRRAPPLAGPPPRRQPEPRRDLRVGPDP